MIIFVREVIKMRFILGVFWWILVVFGLFALISMGTVNTDFDEFSQAQQYLENQVLNGIDRNNLEIYPFKEDYYYIIVTEETEYGVLDFEVEDNALGYEEDDFYRLYQTGLFIKEGFYPKKIELLNVNGIYYYQYNLYRITESYRFVSKTDINTDDEAVAIKDRLRSEFKDFNEIYTKSIVFRVEYDDGSLTNDMPVISLLAIIAFVIQTAVLAFSILAAMFTREPEPILVAVTFWWIEY